MFQRGKSNMAFSNRPMRRSALIGPWGVGAIVPFPNDESLMIALPNTLAVRHLCMKNL